MKFYSECFDCEYGNRRDECYSQYKCIKCDIEYETHCYGCNKPLCPYKLKDI